MYAVAFTRRGETIKSYLGPHGNGGMSVPYAFTESAAEAQKYADERNALYAGLGYYYWVEQVENDQLVSQGGK